MKLITERVNNKKRINEAHHLGIDRNRYIEFKNAIRQELPWIKLQLTNIPMEFEEDSASFILSPGMWRDQDYPISEVKVTITDLQSMAYKINYFIKVNLNGYTSKEVPDFIQGIKHAYEDAEDFVSKVIEKIKEYYTFE